MIGSKSVPKLASARPSARSVNVAKRLKDSETKKAVLALRLQKEMRYKPHQAISAAKRLLRNPSVAHMDLERVNLKSLLRDAGEGTDRATNIAAMNRSLESTDSGRATEPQPQTDTLPSLKISASTSSIPPPRKTTSRLLPAKDMWTDIVKYNSDLAAVEEETKKEAALRKRAEYQRELERQKRESQAERLKLRKKEDDFVALQNQQLRDWKKKQQQLRDKEAQRRARMQQDMAEATADRETRMRRDREAKLREEEEMLQRIKDQEEAHRAEVAAKKEKQRLQMEATKKDNAARLEMKRRETAKARADDQARAEEFVRLQNAKDAKREAELQARIERIQKKMNMMAEVQKESDSRAADDAARAEFESKRRAERDDMLRREKERQRHIRNEETKAYLDMQLAEKQRLKVQAREDDLAFARRARETAKRAEEEEAMKKKKKMMEQERLRLELKRQMEENSKRRFGPDESDLERKLNQGMLKKIDEHKRQSVRRGDRAVAAAARTRGRAESLLAQGSPKPRAHPTLG